VFSQLEKTRLVKKLKAARPQEGERQGRYTGRKSHVEKRPQVVALVKRLYGVNPKTGERRSLREISADLVDAGFVNEYGKPYHPRSIQRMIDGDRPPTLSDFYRAWPEKCRSSMSFSSRTFWFGEIWHRCRCVIASVKTCGVLRRAPFRRRTCGLFACAHLRRTLRFLALDLGSGDTEPNLRRFNELVDGAERFRTACPCFVGLIQADLSALSNHVAHKRLDTDVIALEPNAS
jgi:hypothetical protein